MKANKTEKGITYIRENWKEWFYMDMSATLFKFKEEGMRVPRFYLPVNYLPIRNCYQCWIFPLAPFVLIGLIFWRAIVKIWRDLMEVLEMLNF